MSEIDNHPWRWHTTFCGVNMAHNYYVHHLISGAVQKCQPEVIVEIGTFHGAMSLCLSLESIRMDCPFFTVDIRKQHSAETQHLFDELGTVFLEIDCFKDRDYIFELIRGRRVYVICDGGNKKEEFAMIVPELSPGSVISVHDYSTEFTKEHHAPFDHLLEPYYEAEWMRHDARFATWVKK